MADRILRPTMYAEKEGGAILPWKGTALSEFLLEDRRRKATKGSGTIYISGVSVHALIFDEGNGLFSRWDVVNGWRRNSDGSLMLLPAKPDYVYCPMCNHGWGPWERDGCEKCGWIPSTPEDELRKRWDKDTDQQRFDRALRAFRLHGGKAPTPPTSPQAQPKLGAVPVNTCWRCQRRWGISKDGNCPSCGAPPQPQDKFHYPPQLPNPSLYSFKCSNCGRGWTSHRWAPNTACPHCGSRPTFKQVQQSKGYPIAGDNGGRTLTKEQVDSLLDEAAKGHDFDIK